MQNSSALRNFSATKSFSHRTRPPTDLESMPEFPEIEDVFGGTMVQSTGVRELTGHAATYGSTEFLLCKFFLVLIQNEEKLIKAKGDFVELRFDYEQRLLTKFSPVQIFQRLDRAGKGYLTRPDILKFLSECGFEEGLGYSKRDLKLVVKQTKTDYARFVRLLIDTKSDHKTAVYYNERMQECDQVIRKIDKLPPLVEKALCELLLLQIDLKKDAEFYRAQIKDQVDYDLLKLFKTIAFENARDAAKQIYPSDLVRFFRFNKMLVEEGRIQDIFYSRLVGRNKVFDYGVLHKLITQETLSSIVHNPAIQVGGLGPDQRRNAAHKASFNQKTLASLTAPNDASIRLGLHGTAQPLRNRCHTGVAPACPHSGGQKAQTTGKKADQSCKLGKAAHTKCFHTDHITDEKMVSHFQRFMTDQLVLDNEMEDARIRLACERDFYPKVCFNRFLATHESKQSADTPISEMRATADTIFEFISSVPRPEVGMIQLGDLQQFLVKANKTAGCKNPLDLTYNDFLEIISPRCRDFTELMIQRQTDLDLHHHETGYIDTILDKSQREGTLGDTMCRQPRVVFIEQAMHSNVAQLLAETFLRMVLTFHRNIEIVKTYEMATKGRHNGSHILRYVPQEDVNSPSIKTTDVLRFVKSRENSRERSLGRSAGRSREASLGRSGERTWGQPAPGGTLVGQMIAQLPYTPARVTRVTMEQEDSMLLKSCEKEVVYLAERFGQSGSVLAKSRIDDQVTLKM